MHAVQQACLGQLTQIAPDGLQRHLEPLGQIVDLHTTLAARQIKNLVLPNAQCHVASLVARFPDEDEAIREYAQVCHTANMNVRFVGFRKVNENIC